jgi:hypothetical protein
VIREGRELLAELARLSRARVPFAMPIIEGGVLATGSTALPADIAEPLSFHTCEPASVPAEQEPRLRTSPAKYSVQSSGGS